MCTIRECKFIGKNAKNLSLNEIQRQIDKCERCCHKKSVDKYKRVTYAEVRFKCVDYYYNDPSKYAEAQRRQNV